MTPLIIASLGYFPYLHLNFVVGVGDLYVFQGQLSKLHQEPNGPNDEVGCLGVAAFSKSICYLVLFSDCPFYSESQWFLVSFFPVLVEFSRVNRAYLTACSTSSRSWSFLPTARRRGCIWGRGIRRAASFWAFTWLVRHVSMYEMSTSASTLGHSQLHLYGAFVRHQTGEHECCSYPCSSKALIFA